MAPFHLEHVRKELLYGVEVSENICTNLPLNLLNGLIDQISV